MKLLKNDNNEDEERKEKIQSLCKELSKEIDICMETFKINGVINRRLATRLLVGFEGMLLHFFNEVYSFHETDIKKKNERIIMMISGIMDDVFNGDI